LTEHFAEIYGMTQLPKNVKLIYDPLWGIVDITQFIPMIDTPEFQALGFKYQLGVASFLFPAATHTRKQHSLGAFKRTQRLTDLWLHRGFINKEEAELLCGFALWHDIGHGPFSHSIEEVTQELWNRNHDENGAIVINNMKDVVGKAGLDFEELKKFFTRENPLYLAVHDKNLGTEKLDYLSRDAYYTIGEVPGVEYVAEHTYFVDDRIMIDEKAMDDAKTLQDFYIKMFKSVYLRKNPVIAQRIMQKMLLELIQTENIQEQELWAMTDFGLLGRLENSEHPRLQNIVKRFLRRDWYKTAVAVKIEDFAGIEKRKDKAQTLFGISEGEMLKLSKSEKLLKPSELLKVEIQIEQMLNLPEQSVLVVPPASLERFTPQDIDIYVAGESPAKLSDYFPNHYRSMEEEGKSYMTMRVCTFPEHREKLSELKIAEEIKEYLLALINK
jgi:HD superfamily phosphohydrolase